MQVNATTPATGTSASYQAAQTSQTQRSSASPGDPDGDHDIEAAEKSAQQVQETGTGITFTQLA